MKISENELREIIREELVEDLLLEFDWMGAKAAASSAIKKAGEKVSDIASDVAAAVRGGACSAVPALCKDSGGKKWLGAPGIGVSDPGFWDNFRSGLESHVNSVYPELGLRTANLGIARDLDASANPSSSARAAGSKHGAGLAHDLYLHTDKYGEYTSYRKDNKKLVKDQKLIGAIRSYVAKHPRIRWGGEFGSGPVSGSRGELEFHHFEFKNAEMPQEFAGLESELQQIGIDPKSLTSTRALGNLYSKLA